MCKGTRCVLQVCQHAYQNVVVDSDGTTAVIPTYHGRKHSEGSATYQTIIIYVVSSQTHILGAPR